MRTTQKQLEIRQSSSNSIIPEMLEDVRNATETIIAPCGIESDILPQSVNRDLFLINTRRKGSMKRYSSLDGMKWLMDVFKNLLQG